MAPLCMVCCFQSLNLLLFFLTTIPYASFLLVYKRLTLLIICDTMTYLSDYAYKGQSKMTTPFLASVAAYLRHPVCYSCQNKRHTRCGKREGALVKLRAYLALACQGKQHFYWAPLSWLFPPDYSAGVQLWWWPGLCLQTKLQLSSPPI